MRSLARLLTVGTSVASALVLGGAGAGSAAIPATTALFHRPIVVVGTNQSNNWSGYNQGTLEQGGKSFHQISGTWVVPTASAHKAGENEYSASWVGIGGGCIDATCMVTDSTLIQAGTSQDVDTAGRATYYAWWEIIPAPSVQVSLPVAAGDTVTVNIAETTPQLWSIGINNVTTGQSWSTTVPYSSTYATAEWIEETPVVIDNSGAVSIGPMPDLSSVNFDASTTNGTNAGLKSSDAMQLVDANRVPLATPSSPDPDTDGFNDCTYAGTCGAPASS
jgi:hypothetical protein